jgi:hypothetical protein
MRLERLHPAPALDIASVIRRGRARLAARKRRAHRIVRRIEPTRAALADFDAIYDHIAKVNPRAAADILRDIDPLFYRKLEWAS